MKKNIFKLITAALFYVVPVLTMVFLMLVDTSHWSPAFLATIRPLLIVSFLSRRDISGGITGVPLAETSHAVGHLLEQESGAEKGKREHWLLHAENELGTATSQIESGKPLSANSFSSEAVHSTPCQIYTLSSLLVIRIKCDRCSAHSIKWCAGCSLQSKMRPRRSEK